MSGQKFNTIDACRLEVAVKPTTPYNLVANPSGALGAWGWVTPGNSYMRSAVFGGALDHLAGAATGTYFMTEPMPITAGHYAAAAFRLPNVSPPITPSPLTWQIEWLSSTYAVVGTTAASAPISTYSTFSLPAAQAPAGTSFFRLRFNQAGSGSSRITDVRAATATTAAGLTSGTLLNAVPNPSFEVDLAGWDAQGSGPPVVAAINRTTTAGEFFVGSAALRAVRTAPGPGLAGAYTQNRPVVTGGLDYTFRVMMKSADSGGYGRLQIAFYDNVGTQTGVTSTYQTPGSISTTAFEVVTLTATAPSNAVTASLSMLQAVGAPGAYRFFDAVSLSTVNTYWDGSTAASGQSSFSWTGTAHNSPSLRTDTTLSALAETEWRNILGPTHRISTVREALNIGTMEAELLDATLDPATSSTLRPGGDVRVLALVSAVWEPIFVGQIDRLLVTYDDKRRPIRPPRVSMTALDRTVRLTAAKRTHGVAAVASLPHLIEGAGLPWNVDGSTAQLLVAPGFVSINDNASALDQVALTRDSTGSHAWVDRKGVLVATTTTGASVRTLDEPRYSDLAVAFSSEECINAVEIESLYVVDDVTPTGGAFGRSDSTLYGPYEDPTSIAQWGRRLRRFRVHGLTPAQINTLAAAILTRNANPGVSVQGVTLPMRDAADLADAVRDLGEIVTVSNTSRAIAPVLRVTRVAHTIESAPQKWMTRLGFSRSTSVASPTIQPEVQETRRGFEDTPWATAPLINGWTHFDGSGAPVQYRRHGGFTVLRGLVTSGTGGTTAFVLPPGFRGAWLRGNSHWPVVNTDGPAFCRVWSSGDVAPAQGGTYIDLGSIAFLAEQ